MYEYWQSLKRLKEIIDEFNCRSKKVLVRRWANFKVLIGFLSGVGMIF
jgi:hypothetical protein